MLTDILREHNVQFLTEGHHHCRPGWVQVDCPFCGEGSKKYHLGISTALTGANCWRCGPHGLRRVLVKLLSISFTECGKLIANTAAVFTEEKVSGKLVLPYGVGPLQEAHVRYLVKRGFDPDELRVRWGLKGIGVATRLSWRIFIPIYSGVNIVSWTTRSISDDGLRYIAAGRNEEAVSRKRLLYGEQYARHSILVCEGPSDVWKIGPGAVATMGTGYSTAQIKKISKRPVRGIVFDNEEAAQQRASDLCDLLSLLPGRTYNVVLDAKDPGSASCAEIKKLRALIS